MSRIPLILIATACATNLSAADHHDDRPLGAVAPGQHVNATATPPGIPLSGEVTSAGGWPWIAQSLVSFNATVPASFAGTHMSTFAGTFDLPSSGGGGGSGGGRKPFTWDMFATADDGEWEADRSIEGVGEIEKTDPVGPFSNNLHYAGTNTPEIATFRIDMEDAKDIDRNSETGESRDAGIDEDSTEWKVPAGSGTMTQGRFTSVFTPSSSVRQDITVEAVISEGKKLSYEDDNFDARVTKKWAETLTTFKVGVILNPGNKTIFEDDTSSDHSINLGSAFMGGRIEDTGILSEPGASEEGGELPVKSLSWQAIAATSGGQLSGIMKSIKYSPSISAQGSYRMFIVPSGLLPPDVPNELNAFISLLGKASSYVQAGISITKITAGSLKASAIVAGNSVLENQKANEVAVQVNLRESETKTADMSSLSIAGSLVKAGPGDTIRGSITAQASASADDSSITSGVTVVLEEEANTSATASATVPTYGD